MVDDRSNITSYNHSVYCTTYVYTAVTWCNHSQRVQKCDSKHRLLVAVVRPLTAQPVHHFMFSLLNHMYNFIKLWQTILISLVSALFYFTFEFLALKYQELPPKLTWCFHHQHCARTTIKIPGTPTKTYLVFPSPTLRKDHNFTVLSLLALTKEFSLSNTDSALTLLLWPWKIKITVRFIVWDILATWTSSKQVDQTPVG